MIYGFFYPLSKNNPTASQAKNDSQTILTSLQLCNVHYIPCELRFFSCMAFSVNEVVRAAFQSRGKAMQERKLCSQRTIIVRLRGSLLGIIAILLNNYQVYNHGNFFWIRWYRERKKTLQLHNVFAYQLNLTTFVILLAFV